MRDQGPARLVEALALVAGAGLPFTRQAEGGALVEPSEPRFTGFVFKIQANMDPSRRDRIAFVRVCSGKFTRGMEVRHARTGEVLRLNRPLQFLAQERMHVEEAWPSEILGL